jgi:tetratricopeptide (TPR) repeat protein
MRAALIATIFASSLAASQPAIHESPLIAYANELEEAQSGHIAPTQSELGANHVANTNLRAVTFEMARHPPPRDEDCAHTLGASRFAGQYAELAVIQEELGNYQAVIEASKSALACAPRDASYEASIASAHLNLGQIAAARAAAERGNRLDPDDRGVRDVRARVDFIQEHWADATARFRLQAMERGYAHLTDYPRCYLWLAQRRAGVREPELPPRNSGPDSHGSESGTLVEPSEAERWPAQILETLRGERSEADLVKAIRDGAKGTRREWLTEALFYVGELRLAEGDVEAARRHFATVVNLRVLNFVEYGMARAELAKMRERPH